MPMRSILVVITIAAAALSSRAASAQPACRSLPDEPAGGPIPKIYIENGDTQEPLIKRLGRKLLVHGRAGAA